MVALTQIDLCLIQITDCMLLFVMIVIHTYTQARVLVKFSVSSTCQKVGIAIGIFEYCQCHCAVVFMLGVGIWIFEYCHCAVVFVLGVPVN